MTSRTPGSAEGRRKRTCNGRHLAGGLSCGGSVSAREGTVMPQDAPVNAGAADRPGLLAAEDAVARMQARLHLWAARDPGRRFGDLFNLVYDPAFLLVAWERVATNRGANTPGIDRATAGQVETLVGVGEFLGRLRDSLKSGEFRPVEVRRVLIPKKNGKLRKLGIPTIADRVVQASLKLVLEPVFEADFKPCSYGFRPNRRAQDAIAEIHHLASEPINYHWVLEADIKACFDEISHTALMSRLRARIKDKRMCALVKAFLKSGVLTELGTREETYTGTPQGGTRGSTSSGIASAASGNAEPRSGTSTPGHLRRQSSRSRTRYRRRRTGQPATRTWTTSSGHQPGTGRLGELLPARRVQGHLQRNR